jgi:hypothetical protein
MIIARQQPTSLANRRAGPEAVLRPSYWISDAVMVYEPLLRRE